MCRNIKTLFNFDPPASEEEIRAASLQFVRKLSGFHKPSQANEPAFNQAIDQVADAARRLIDSLTTGAAPRDGSHARPVFRFLKSAADYRPRLSLDASLRPTYIEPAGSGERHEPR